MDKSSSSIKTETHSRFNQPGSVESKASSITASRPVFARFKVLRRSLVLALVATTSVATPVFANDQSVDVSTSFTEQTCAKMTRLAEGGSWRVGKNGALVSIPRARTFKVAPDTAPEWVRDLLNGVKLESSVILRPQAANPQVLDALCFTRLPGTATWRSFGTATLAGSLDLQLLLPTFSPVLSAAECGSLLSTVAAAKGWEPSRTSTGAFRSTPRDFTGLEELFNKSALSPSATNLVGTPLRFAGVSTKFLITARQVDTVNASATCFAFDPVLSGWVKVGTTLGQVQLTLPEVPK